MLCASLLTVSLACSSWRLPHRSRASPCWACCLEALWQRLLVQWEACMLLAGGCSSRSQRRASSAMQENPSKPKSESDFDECYFFEPYSDATGIMQPA